MTIRYGGGRTRDRVELLSGDLWRDVVALRKAVRQFGDRWWWCRSRSRGCDNQNKLSQIY
ncbi:hypothetical protein [Nonomuraea polychroma]|nr:hypothetical protein [Nonomuraea polychroma]